VDALNEQFERKIDLFRRICQNRDSLMALNAEAIAVFGEPLVDIGPHPLKDILLRIFTTEQDAKMIIDLLSAPPVQQHQQAEPGRSNSVHNPDEIRTSIDQKFRLLDQLDTLLAEAEQLNEQHLADGGSGPLVTYTPPHESDRFTHAEIRHMLALYQQQRRADRASGQ
jgi:hypothetical protein